MGCSECQEKPKREKKSCGLPPVLEVHSEECPVLFHTVEVEGTIEDNPPEIGKHRNTLVVYKGDDYKVLYSSDGIPSNLGNAEGAGDFNSLLNRPKYAGSQMTGETSIPDVDAAVKALDDSLATVAKTGAYSDLTGTPTIPTRTSDLVNNGADGTSTYVEASGLPPIDSAFSTSSENAVQNKVVSGALNRAVDTGLTVDDNPSTTVLQLKEAQANLMTGVSTTNNIPLPVASSTQAGVMNSATFDAVTANTTNINAILNGAVAITGLSASPTQSELTTAWQTATGLTTLINRASVYDVTNDKVWTYYTNDTTWHATSSSSQVTVSQFTNSSLGTIMGSTTDGQIFAESNGTGSVNGWDTLTGAVATNTSKLSGIAAGAEVNVQSNWTEADSSSDAYILNKPTVDSALNSSSTNAIQNKPVTEEFEKVTYIDDTVGTTTNIAYVATSNIQDGAVTAAKLGPDTEPAKETGTGPFTARTGYSISNFYGHKQGTHYWGDFMLNKTTGNFSNSDEIVATMSVVPDGAFSFNCAASATQWSRTFTMCHAFITNYSGTVSGPALIIGADSSTSWVRVHYDFVATS